MAVIIKPSLKKFRHGSNRIRTQDLCDTGAVLYQLSYQASWELAALSEQFVIYL